MLVLVIYLGTRSIFIGWIQTRDSSFFYFYINLESLKGSDIRWNRQRLFQVEDEICFKSWKSWLIWALKNWCKFQLFAINNKENCSSQRLRKCWLAKTFMSSTDSVRYICSDAQSFRDNWNFYDVLSIFKDFILLLASSENDKHTLMRQINECK